MGEELVLFGVQKLWELLGKENEQLQGIKDQVSDLQSSLRMLMALSKDADAKKHTCARVKTSLEEIKEIIYNAEDVIETYIQNEKLGKTRGIMNRVRRLACIIPEHRSVALEIEDISKKISNVNDAMKSYGVLEIINNGGSVAQGEMRQTFSSKDESDLVGLEENIKKLVELMVVEENVQVVSITGMGGVGKTTLAKEVFNHEKVKQHFDGLAWVCVSQEFDWQYVWQTILQNLRPEEDRKKISEMTVSELQREFYQLLEKSKSLIILDDIWEEKHWGKIKNMLPREKGSKVLLTSRKKSVAGPNNIRHINFPSELLSGENSWTLLQRIAFPKKDASEMEIDESMESIAKQMIKHCGGLPLAIKVLGGLLAAKHTVGDWERISEGIGSRILEGSSLEDDNNNSVDHILSLSFEELPNYLKHCFLYLAHFPEDYTIDLEALSYYWAAEEIRAKPRDYHRETIRDVANSYIEELVGRNMVIAERKNSALRFETCHLHDMMREMCLSKAKEENFLQIVGINSAIPDSQSHSAPRRLVTHNPSTLHAERDFNNPKLRSFLIIEGGETGKHWTASCLPFKRLRRLRVLDLSRANYRGHKVPSSIGKLTLLRYLSLHASYVSHLPSSLRNLKLLIYLNIGIYTPDICVPNFLMEMQELRYLVLPRRMHKKTKLQLSNLGNLETLKKFSTVNSSLEDLHCMVKLRKLSIIINDETSIETLSTSIAGLRHLEYFSIKRREWTLIKMKKEGRFVLDFIHLKHLKLDIPIPRLPDVQQLPSNLTSIVLKTCRLEEDPMPILEKLPHLEVVRLRYYSFDGKIICCSGNGFRKLRELEFMRICLEEWRIEKGSMPLLHTLEIHDCWWLEKLPDGLQFIKSLKELNVDKKYEERLREGGEDYYKVQHIPSVKFQFKPS